MLLDWKNIDKDEKRAVMSRTREIAFAKAAQGTCVIMQKGLVIDNPSKDTVRGPIRIRKAYDIPTAKDEQHQRESRSI